MIVAVTGLPGIRGEGGDHDYTDRLCDSAVPVALGLVASLNRPGGNLTGVATLTVQLGAQQLEMLHALVPTATISALLVQPD